MPRSHEKPLASHLYQPTHPLFLTTATLVALLLILLLLSTVWLSTMPLSQPSSSSLPTSASPSVSALAEPITTDTQIQAADQALDAVDLNQIKALLDQNSVDAATF